MAGRKRAFLGLGVMGYPMAGHLARAGHDVTVYNRTGAKAEQWVAQHGGRLARTPDDAAATADVVLMCVGNDNDVRSVAGRALTTMRAGTTLVDHTTASAEVAREMHVAAQRRSVGFLDAPVSGGQAGAENGKLTIMVGGAADAYARAEPLLLDLAAWPEMQLQFIPKYACWLNLIEPWWKQLRSLALKGWRFENLDQLTQALNDALGY